MIFGKDKLLLMKMKWLLATVNPLNKPIYYTNVKYSQKFNNVR
jgi:hypothetical protein